MHVCACVRVCVYPSKRIHFAVCVPIGTKFKSLENLPTGWTDWHQIWYTSAHSSGNGHRLNTISPAIPGGGGILGCQVVKMSSKV